MKSPTNRELLLAVVVAGALNLILGLGALIKAHGQTRSISELEERLEQLETKVLPKLSLRVDKQRDESHQHNVVVSSNSQNQRQRLDTVETRIKAMEERVGTFWEAGVSWASDVNQIKKAIQRISTSQPRTKTHSSGKGTP